jgi:hypothetical protein
MSFHQESFPTSSDRFGCACKKRRKRSMSVGSAKKKAKGLLINVDFPHFVFRAFVHLRPTEADAMTRSYLPIAELPASAFRFVFVFVIMLLTVSCSSPPASSVPRLTSLLAIIASPESHEAKPVIVIGYFRRGDGSEESVPTLSLLPEAARWSTKESLVLRFSPSLHLSYEELKALDQTWVIATGIVSSTSAGPWVMYAGALRNVNYLHKAVDMQRGRERGLK